MHTPPSVDENGSLNGCSNGNAGDIDTNGHSDVSDLTEEEKEKRLVANMSLELKSKPHLGNWIQLKEAENKFAMMCNRLGKTMCNGSGLSDESLHQENNSSHNVDNNSSISKSKQSLIQNIKLEMASEPFMANWAQIRDAEHRLVSSSDRQLSPKQSKPSKQATNKVRLYFQSFH